VSQRLLLIEDEENIAFALRYNLEDEGYSVVHVDCLARADEELRGGSYDVGSRLS
jgi:DNA-binding response OmpR family regulator